MVGRARAGPIAAPAWVAAAVMGLAALSTLSFAFARSRIGVAFSSDTYSYLVWARRAIREGELGHTPYDYTAPKPLEMLVAATGELIQAPVALFGSWAMLSWAAAVLAAAALAKRVAGWLAACTAAALSIVLPPLVLHGYAADSTVPYAALVVGAAAVSPSRPALASGFLGTAGLLRPEAWGLAALHALLTWRRSAGRERAISVASALVPPAVWLTFDYVATGDLLYGAHAVERFGVRPVPLHDLPSVVGDLVPSLLGWPLVALALAAFVGGLRRRPVDPAVVFPAAIAIGLAFELRLGLIGAQTVDRYGLGLYLFLPVGGAVALVSVPRRLRVPVVVAGVALCLWAVRDELTEIREFHERRGRGATELENGMAAAARRAIADGELLATERQWQGAISLYGRVPRDQVVPVEEVGRNVSQADVGAYLVIVRQQQLRAGRGPTPLDGLRPSRQSRRWRLYFSAEGGT